MSSTEDLYQQINQVKKDADDNRVRAVSEISQSLKSNELLHKNWNLLRNHVEVLQGVQKSLEAADQIVYDDVSEATNYRNSRDRKSNGTLDGLYRERRRVLDEREKKERSLSEGRDRARLVFGNVKHKKPLKKFDRSKSLRSPLILRGL